MPRDNRLIHNRNSSAQMAGLPSPDATVADFFSSELPPSTLPAVRDQVLNFIQGLEGAPTTEQPAPRVALVTSGGTNVPIEVSTG